MVACTFRPTCIEKNGKEHAYWTLVRSVRTPRGPRQVIVAYVGAAADEAREGVRQAAQGTGERQKRLFDDVQPDRTGLKWICRGCGWSGREVASGG